MQPCYLQNLQKLLGNIALQMRDVQKWVIRGDSKLGNEIVTVDEIIQAVLSESQEICDEGEEGEKITHDKERTIDVMFIKNGVTTHWKKNNWTQKKEDYRFFSVRLINFESRILFWFKKTIEHKKRRLQIFFG